LRLTCYDVTDDLNPQKPWHEEPPNYQARCLLTFDVKRVCVCNCLPNHTVYHRTKLHLALSLKAITVSLSNIMQDKAAVCIELRIGKLEYLGDWKDAACNIITVYSRGCINVSQKRYTFRFSFHIINFLKVCYTRVLLEYIKKMKFSPSQHEFTVEVLNCKFKILEIANLQWLQV